MGEFVSLDVHNSIGTIRLNRPPLNALNRRVQDEISQLALEADRRADIDVVIIYGGEKVFAAGADIKEMEAMSYQDMLAAIGRLQADLGAVSHIQKPTIAALTGYALGGGMELALSCDFRIAGDNVKVGQPEIQLGIIPGGGGTQRLARLVGSARAKDLIFTGRHVRMDEALSIGLVDRVVAPDLVYSSAVEFAQQFVGGPKLAIAAAKQAIDEGLSMSLDSGLKLEQHLFAGLFATEDRSIGMKSFIDSGPGSAGFKGN